MAFEGIDGSGKSTQLARLAARLGPDVVTTAEPGGTPLGDQLRRLLLDPGRPAVSVRAEALLMAADRAEHVEVVIRPALAAGRWVLTDRFTGSTRAYQGAGRRLGGPGLDAVLDWAAAGLEPDLTVLIDVPVEVGRQRRPRGADDRLEALDPGFHQRVRTGYLELAAAGRWAVVDGDRPVDAVAGDVLDAVTARLGRPGRG